MAAIYESVVRPEGVSASEVPDILACDGERGPLAHLRAGRAPGDGTLTSGIGEPWKRTDRVYREGDCVLYYDTGKGHAGLFYRLADHRPPRSQEPAPE